MDTLDERSLQCAEELMKHNPGITEQSLERMIDAFRVMDADGSQKLEQPEVMKCLQALGGNPTPQKVQELINQLDHSGDGKVDLAEFFNLAKFVKVGQAEKEDLTAAFKVFDKDGNGKICKSELRSVLKSMDQYTDDAELDMMIQSADTNGDGFLDIKELVDVFNTRIEDL